MGQHPAVLKVMHEVLESCGAAQAVPENISGFLQTRGNLGTLIGRSAGPSTPIRYQSRRRPPLRQRLEALPEADCARCHP
jgi:hypothetical protein